MKSRDHAQRLYFVDNLRVMIIILVLAHHAGQAYGPTGGVWPIDNPEKVRMLSTFFLVNASFFMGLLFLISGYFTAVAFARKGAAGFLRERFRRIGIPLAFFVLTMNLVISYAIYGGDVSFGEYLLRPWRWEWQIMYAHLWFLGHLLVYALLYALWKTIFKAAGPPGGSGTPGTPGRSGTPGHGAILLYVLVLGIVTYFVRRRYPIDRWVVWLVPVELAHFPQYVSLFVMGTLAWRGDWFRKIPAAAGRVWMAVGLAAAGLLYVYGALRLKPSIPAFTAMGGPGWRSLVQSCLEAFLAVGLSIGLLVWLRERFNRPNRLMAAMSADSYFVYIIHLYLVIALQAALHSAPLPPFVKFLLVTVSGVLICFSLSHLVRKVSFTRGIL
jgi:glucan biosynthesis protein C